MKIISGSEQETEKTAGELSRRIGPGSFIALTGELGAGKTAFTRGLARGLGVKRNVLSPTFTILREYPDGTVPLYHFDVYRIGDENGLEDAGFYDERLQDGITVCEWADLIPDAVPAGAIWVHISADDDGMRTIEIGGGGL